MMTINPQQLIQMLRHTLQSDADFMALHEPCFKGNEWKYVKECLDTGWVSSVGKFVDQFEKDLCDFTGAKYAVVTVNGTAALHICYQLAGINRGDEVLVPTLTFVGTINPILYCGAIPHFIDAEPEHLGIDIFALDNYLREITYFERNTCMNRMSKRPIRALCAMHTLGHPVDLDQLSELCDKYHLILIEDAAEAIGSLYKGVHVGHQGLVGALSFNGNKIITTGGGGAILTNHAALAKQAKHMTTTAKIPHAWLFEHDITGYNYRLPNINAALGCAQLEMLPAFLRAKRALAEQYQCLFADMIGVRLMTEPAFAKSNYWLNAILLDQPLAAMKEQFLTEMIQSGIMVRPLWNLQHLLTKHQHFPAMPVPHAENLAQRLIKLPSSPQLMEELT
jgi:perosamine synthetase